MPYKRYKKYLLFTALLCLSTTWMFGQRWTGTQSDDWHHPGNWEQGALPFALSEVVIDTAGQPRFFPRISAPASVASLQMGPGTSLTFDGHVLTVLGRIDITDALLLHKGETAGRFRREASMEPVSIQGTQIDVPTELTVYAADSQSRYILIGGCTIEKEMTLQAYGLNDNQEKAGVWLGYVRPAQSRSNRYRAPLHLLSVNTETATTGGLIYLEHHAPDSLTFEGPVRLVLGSSSGWSDTYRSPLAANDLIEGHAHFPGGLIMQKKDFTRQEMDPEVWEALKRQMWIKEQSNLLIIGAGDDE